MRVTYGEFSEGDLRRFLDINALAAALPPLTDGAQLETSIMDMGALGKLIVISVPNTTAGTQTAGTQTAPAAGT